MQKLILCKKKEKKKLITSSENCFRAILKLFCQYKFFWHFYFQNNPKKIFGFDKILPKMSTYLISDQEIPVSRNNCRSIKLTSIRLVVAFSHKWCFCPLKVDNNPRRAAYWQALCSIFNWFFWVNKKYHLLNCSSSSSSQVVLSNNIFYI